MSRDSFNDSVNYILFLFYFLFKITFVLIHIRTKFTNIDHAFVYVRARVCVTVLLLLEK